MSGIVWAFLFFCVACMTICKVATIFVQARDKRGSGSGDTATIQEIHRGLQRMADRVEALETIIMDSYTYERSGHRAGSRFD